VLMLMKEASNPCPSGRIGHPLNKQKVTFEGQSERKNSFFVVRSWNVYENKENMDKMDEEETDIFGILTVILQKSTAFDEQIAVIKAFAAVFLRKFTPMTNFLPRSPLGCRGGPRASFVARRISTGRSDISTDFPAFAQDFRYPPLTGTSREEHEVIQLDAEANLRAHGAR